MGFEILEALGRISCVNKETHPQHLGKITYVFNAGHCHGGSPHDRMPAMQANALVLITTDGAGATRPKAKAQGNIITIGPHSSNLTAHGQDIPATDGKPLLNTQSRAVQSVKLALEWIMHAEIQINQVALSRVIFVIDIAAQYLPKPFDGRTLLAPWNALDIGFVPDRHQAPLGLILGTALTIKIIFGFQAGSRPGLAHSFDIVALVNCPQTMSKAADRWRKMHIMKKSLSFFIQPQPGFGPQGQTKNDIMSI